MRPELDIYGIFVPTLAALALVSFVLSAILRRILAFIGFYRLVWHRPLFDTAIYVCLLGTLAFTINRIPFL